MRYHVPSKAISVSLCFLPLKRNDRRSSSVNKWKAHLLFLIWFGKKKDSDDDISHLEWETVRVRLIKAGTLEKLVESLASDTGELESTYVNIFLATYRTFSTANQILALVAKRYADLNHPTVLESVRQQNKKYVSTLQTSSFDRHHHQSQRPHSYICTLWCSCFIYVSIGESRTLRSTLHVWLDAFPEDFRDPPDYPLLNQFLSFCEQHAKDSELHFKVKHRMERLIKNPEPGELIRDDRSSFDDQQLLFTFVFY